MSNTFAIKDERLMRSLFSKKYDAGKSNQFTTPLRQNPYNRKTIIHLMLSV
ncbi:hypothetical protein SAMN05216602_2430 [Pseudomonas argentinensis]|uniref:Uncharacterized protein n=1 Tax=Phytopseudomonas argentinensis TaxID=289370 RepID=A0A1I3KCV4_9GAMM|nr:hypothetical protein SAMN05216602_2430 [Pseudomonas argentinensis]